MEVGLANLKEDYRIYILKKAVFMVSCIAVAFIALGFSVSFGKYDIGFFESYRIIIDHLMGREPADAMKHFIVWELRLPRAFMAIAVGAGLGIGGAAMQSMLRNPLADPYTTGVASGASLGAAVAIILGICLIPSITGEAAIVVNAFFFSLIPATIIVLISKYKKTTPTMIILAGIGVMYIFSATTSLLMLMADPNALAEVYIWTVGSLGKATWENIPLVISVVIIGIIIIQINAKNLNILAMGDKNAMSLGVNALKIRLLLLVTIALLTAGIVSFTGTIGFVGLVAPHIVRIFLGSDNRYLVPASASLGAALLIVADCFAKEAGTTGLPVGVITAIIGGPIFLMILIKMKKSAWN